MTILKRKENLENLDIRTFGDKILTRPSIEVDLIDDDIISLSHKMYGKMLSADGIGLAAPQVGISIRLFVYDLGSGMKIIANPNIEESSGSCLMEEACLSIPGYAWDISRPENVSVSGIDIDGNSLRMDASGIFARLIQHEIDHLNGILLLDHLDEDEKTDAFSRLIKNS